MMSLILGFLPDHMLILVVMAVAVGLMIRVVSRQAALGVIGAIALFALLSPFIDSLMSVLPVWLLVIIGGLFFLTVIQTVFKSIFGKGASDHFMGHLLWTLFAAPFRILGYLFGIRRR